MFFFVNEFVISKCDILLQMIQKFTPSHESCLICEVILADLEILLTDGKDEVSLIIPALLALLPAMFRIQPLESEQNSQAFSIDFKFFIVNYASSGSSTIF